MNNTSKKTAIIWSYKLIYLLFFLCAIGCRNQVQNADLTELDKVLNQGETEQISEPQLAFLDSMRTSIGSKDLTRLVKYYNTKSCYALHAGNLDSLKIYADSAIRLFAKTSLIQQNQRSYFNALLLKGDAAYIDKKYSRAVLHYLEARSFQQKNLSNCERKDLVTRIANVYYIQGKFSTAITFFKEGYQLSQTCPPSNTPIKHFYEIQSLLNTIGFCYERANLLDSAKHFYQEDLIFIGESGKSGNVNELALTDATTIALDNLGSIYLKQNDLSNAEKLLIKSVASHYSGGMDAKIPPLIKLADLYVRKQDYKLANLALDRADSILIHAPNAEFRSRWTNIKSKLYERQGNFKLALYYQQSYFAQVDSINKETTKISSIDVEKEFANLEQQFDLKDLEKKDVEKTNYLILAGFLIILVIIILILLVKNIRQAKKNQLITNSRNAELQESLLKLEDANRNYARVMKVMAHDLRNPLGGISGLSSLLLSEQTLDNDKPALTAIQSSADGALKMIDEILNAVLNKEDEKSLPKTRFDLRSLLQQCVTLLNFKATEKEQELIIIGSSEIWILANEEKLWRVFNNLIVNAIKFSPPQTVVTIQVEQDENYVKVAVIDNGIGIPKALENKIYDIFTEAKRQGTSGEKPYGLGLSISKQIIEAHGGLIWHEANPAGGTIFYIQLPLQ